MRKDYFKLVCRLIYFALFAAVFLIFLYSRFPSGNDFRRENSPFVISDSEPVWSPSGDQLAFASTRSGNGDIWVVGSNGEYLSNLTQQNPGGDSFPQWSPNGQLIAYSSYSFDSANVDIWIMNANGANKTNLTNHPSYDAQAYWSPDGKSLVFVSDRAGRNDIWIMDRDGHNLVNITDKLDASSFFFPMWSPDGRKILFLGTKDGFSQVWVYEKSTMNIQQITIDGHNTAAAWSPDSGQIVVQRKVENWDIWTTSLNNNRMRNLTSDNPQMDSAPIWVSDGNHIIYAAFVEDIQKIIMMNNDGSDKFNLTDDDVSGSDPALSPNGDFLAFINTKNYKINILSLADGEMITIE